MLLPTGVKITKLKYVGWIECFCPLVQLRGGNVH